MNGLTKYDAARHALQVASSVDEVKDIRDKAEAMAAYARQAKDTELVEWATEIKVRAERRAGQMLAEMQKQAGSRGIGKKVESYDVTPLKTLAEIGVSKNESSRWQKLAAVPADQFEQAVAAAKDVAGEVTTAAMLRIEKASRPATSDKKQAGTAPTKHIPEAAPVQQEPAYDPKEDEAAELAETVCALAAENDALKDRLAVAVMPGSEAEKAAVLDTIESLRMEISNLEIELRAVKASRDGYQQANAELKRQCATQRRQLAKEAI